MLQVKDIILKIEETAPLSLAEEWDRVGLMVGSREQPVRRVLVALDADCNVVREAARRRCELILTHHPLLFQPLSSVTDETEIGRTVLFLARHGISLYSAHTNLDSAPGGINDFLCDKIGLIQPESCVELKEGVGLARMGKVEETTLKEYAEKIGKLFHKPFIQFVGDPDKKIRTAAICSGGGGDFIGQVAGLADVYITGDLRYHPAREAEEQGLALIYLEHHESEIYVQEVFARLLQELDVEVIFAEENPNVVKGLVLPSNLTK